MTEQTQNRQVPIEQVLGRYREQLAGAHERAIILEVRAEQAESQLEQTEAECAALRLRVVELESAPVAG